MKLWIVGLILAGLALAADPQPQMYSPVQQAVVGTMNIYTGVYSNLPDMAPASMQPNSAARVYGLVVFTVDSEQDVAAYRIQVTVKFADDTVVQVDDIFASYGAANWFRVATRSPVPPVGISGLVITPMSAKAAKTVMLINPEVKH